jgi:hypothetical protein
LQTALLDDRDRSAFNEFLYEQYNNLSTNLKSQGTNIASIQSPNSPIANPPTIKSISLPLLPYNRSGIDWKDLVGISTKVTLEKSSGISGENVGSVTRMSKNFPFLYIRLGSLLAFIQNNLLYYILLFSTLKLRDLDFFRPKYFEKFDLKVGVNLDFLLEI